MYVSGRTMHSHSLDSLVTYLEAIKAESIEDGHPETRKRVNFEGPKGPTTNQRRSRNNRDRDRRDSTAKNPGDEILCTHCVRNKAPPHVCKSHSTDKCNYPDGFQKGAKRQRNDSNNQNCNNGKEKKQFEKMYTMFHNAEKNIKKNKNSATAQKILQ